MKFIYKNNNSMEYVMIKGKVVKQLKNEAVCLGPRTQTKHLMVKDRHAISVPLVALVVAQCPPHQLFPVPYQLE